LFGFTIDPLGNNLPVEDAPWQSVGNAIPLGITMASTSPEIDKQIERARISDLRLHLLARTLAEPPREGAGLPRQPLATARG
jgi:hypothetical protein